MVTDEATIRAYAYEWFQANLGRSPTEQELQDAVAEIQAQELEACEQGVGAER